VFPQWRAVALRARSGAQQRIIATDADDTRQLLFIQRRVRGLRMVVRKTATQSKEKSRPASGGFPAERREGSIRPSLTLQTTQALPVLAALLSTLSALSGLLVLLPGLLLTALSALLATLARLLVLLARILLATLTALIVLVHANPPSGCTSSTGR
jgi:hypothetical protein